MKYRIVDINVSFGVVYERDISLSLKLHAFISKAYSLDTHANKLNRPISLIHPTHTHIQ